jgi:general secretion pathway protein K
VARNFISTRTYRGGQHERGVALLIVLLLVTIMSVVAVAVADDIRFAVRRTANMHINSQASWYAFGAETLARQALWRSWKANPNRSTLSDPWAREGVVFPIDGGSISGHITDGGTCFNLNSIVERGPSGLFVGSETARKQYIALLTALEFDRRLSASLASALTDWVDSDGASSDDGAEDGTYGARKVPYRTGGTLLAEPSELRAIAGYTEEVYQRLRPMVCALPTTDLSRVNINTVTVQQAPLVVMLAGSELRLAEAQRLIENRPVSGFSSVESFLAMDVFSGLEIDDATRDQFVQRSAYFDVQSVARYHGAHIAMNTLMELDASGKIVAHARRFGTFD